MDDNSNNEATENKSDIDRIKLKEERKLRNKQKKADRQLEKQKNREKYELLKLQPKSNNVILVSRDFADKVAGAVSSGATLPKQEFIDFADFPALSSTACKVKRHTILPSYCVETNNDKKKVSNCKLELADFIHAPSSSSAKQVKNVASSENNYSGNPLDSDMPIRKRGKHREVPKPNNRSTLKQNILNEQNNGDFSNDNCSLSETKLCDNVITKEFDDAVKNLISGIVGLQEKLYNRDPIKGVAKRRYVVGLHEAKKYLKLNKVKMLIIAPDIKLTKRDGALFCAIEELIDLAKANDVNHLFALKRKLLGILTLKYIPISCVVILNYEGLEDQLKNVLELLPLLRRKDESVESKTVEHDVNMKFLNNLMDALRGK